MADGLLAALGEGFRGMGAVASPQVAQQQAQERENYLPNLMRGLQIAKAKRALDADTKFGEILGGMQPSSLDSSGALLDTLKKVPVDVLAESPRAQAALSLASQMQTREAAQDAAKQRIAEARQRAQEQLQYRYDQLDMQREFHQMAAENQSLNADERRRHNEAMERLNGQLSLIRADSLRQNLELRRDVANARADQQRVKVNEPVEDLIKDIDLAIRMVQGNPGVTGARGMFSRGKEFVESTFSGSTDTPANDFQSQILQIQSKWKKLPTVAANRFKADVSKIDNIVKGLGIGTNDVITVNSLNQLRDNLARGLEDRGGTAPTAPGEEAKGGEPTAPKEGTTATSRSGRPVVYRGGKWVYTDGR